MFVIDKPKADIDFQQVVRELQSTIPDHLSYGLDAIYVGNFQDLKQRGVESVYYAGTIYVEPNQESVEDLVSDIVHEIAHFCEENNQFAFIQNDITNEFVSKRKNLYKILAAKGFTEIPLAVFSNPNYSEQLDLYLYKNVGYDLLRDLTGTLFASPYAATSIREYFANGFEHYLYGYKKLGLNNDTLLKSCPKLLKLIRTLITPE